ncbi:MAG: RsmD family RNA methyltransferase, partial [Dehalococcoidia bacterium]
RGLSGRFDIVFIDPPYGEDPFKTLFENMASAGAIKEDAVVFAEHATRTPLEEAYAGVGRTAEHRYGDTTVSVYRPVPGGDTGPG